MKKPFKCARDFLTEIIKKLLCRDEISHFPTRSRRGENAVEMQFFICATSAHFGGEFHQITSHMGVAVWLFQHLKSSANNG